LTLLLFRTPIPQAVAADNGLCLVFDSATFGSGSVASGLVTHVASGRLADAAASLSSSSAADGDDDDGDGSAGADGGATDAGAIEALAWHTMGSLLLGTSTGALGALQPLRASPQRAAPDAQVDASALRRQESVSGGCGLRASTGWMLSAGSLSRSP